MEELLKKLKKTNGIVQEGLYRPQFYESGAPEKRLMFKLENVVRTNDFVDTAQTHGFNISYRGKEGIGEWVFVHTGDKLTDESVRLHVKLEDSTHGGTRFFVVKKGMQFTKPQRDNLLKLISKLTKIKPGEGAKQVEEMVKPKAEPKPPRGNLAKKIAKWSPPKNNSNPVKVKKKN